MLTAWIPWNLGAGGTSLCLTAAVTCAPSELCRRSQTPRLCSRADYKGTGPPGLPTPRPSSAPETEGSPGRRQEAQPQTRAQGAGSAVPSETRGWEREEAPVLAQGPLEAHDVISLEPRSLQGRSVQPD